MGLNMSHGCYDGGYGRFHNLRKEIARLAGLPPLELMDGFYKKPDEPGSPLFVPYRTKEYLLIDHVAERLPIKWGAMKPDVLYKFLYHSDCDGYLTYGVAGKLAKRLEGILDLAKQEGSWAVPEIERLMAGFKDAHSKKQKVTFR